MISKKDKALISNYARNVYDKSFDIIRREAKKQNMDLSLFLPLIMPNVSHDIKLPNTLKNKKKERELWLKERYRVYFFERIINTTYLKLSLKDIKGLVGHTKGGKKTGEKKTLKRIEREEIIIQTEKKLIIDGVKKPTNLRIAQEIPGENEGYVQKFRAKRKKEKKSLLAS